MMKKLLLAATMLTGMFATAQEGYTEVTVNTQPAYTNQVYYKFASNTQTAIPSASWDLSFEKSASQMALGAIRVNDARIRVFQAAGTEAGYATVDVAQEATWTELYNSHLTWSEGAFDNATNTSPLAYGWGNYNPGNHHVEGAIVFVLKFADNTYKKIFIDDFNPFNGNIDFKYASWDGTAWSADQVKTVNAATAPNHNLTYFSLTTNDVVTVAPADTDWDMVFRQYYGPVTAGGQTVMYKVTGALQSPLVSVAQIAETGNTAETPALPATAAYSTEINTIGDDWKAFTGGTYVINPTNTYYVKYADGNIYRMYFTAFSGTAQGTLAFNFKNVSSTAGMEDFDKNAFGFYPNPSVNKNITLIYDLQNGAAKNTLSIYSMTGAKVFETELSADGFNAKEINLSNLTSGIYMVTLESGKNTVSKKLVIQ